MKSDNEQNPRVTPGAIADVDDMLKLVQSAVAQASAAEDTVAASSPIPQQSQLGDAPDTLAALARKIEDLSFELPTAPAQIRPLRLVVATDWSSATLPFAVLRGYREMIPTDAPVELVFAVANDPTDVDSSAVTAIIGAMGGQTEMAGLRVESFAEVSSKACFGAIVPDGDPEALLVELGHFMTVLHHLSVIVRDPELLSQQQVPFDGPNLGLAARLTRFVPG
ncbi:hypothetical protein [Austwickia chelonae]|uniref:hypothetical protein n=1 Tax=Austwickia chelonae TaxID=100225 RepID=UPI000E2607C6|nr:hypothetical protein [Austwickia chelonae]